jgi:hypothetical protein
MKKNKIIETGFSWSAPRKLPTLNEKKEEKVPCLWLCRLGSDLFLVNSTDEIIDEISADSGAMQTIDSAGVSLDSPNGYFYTEVKPNQAVKVDEYDGYYDLDYLIQVYITIRSKTLGEIEIRTPLSKGGIEGNTALMWNKDKLGKNVLVTAIT